MDPARPLDSAIETLPTARALIATLQEQLTTSQREIASLRHQLDPPQGVEKSLAGEGLLAHVVVSKYVDHLPLHRIEGIFPREGSIWPVPPCVDG